MGICESLFRSSSPPKEETITKQNQPSKQIPNNQYISEKEKNGNYFSSPIGDPTNFDNLKNMSMSLSQTTMDNNNSFYPPQKTNLYKYVNKYQQNGNLQMSLEKGSLQHSNNLSSITSGNKGDSKSSDNNLTTSQSFGEFIVEGKINDNMEGDQDFNNFMNMNEDKDNIIDSGKSLDINNKNGNKNVNKRDVNFYHKKNLKNNGFDNKKINEKNKEENIPPMPLDTVE